MEYNQAVNLRMFLPVITVTQPLDPLPKESLWHLYLEGSPPNLFLAQFLNYMFQFSFPLAWVRERAIRLELWNTNNISFGELSNFQGHFGWVPGVHKHPRVLFSCIS